MCFLEIDYIAQTTTIQREEAVMFYVMPPAVQRHFVIYMEWNFHKED